MNSVDGMLLVYGSQIDPTIPAILKTVKVVL